MAIALEKRIRRLEAAAGVGACANPEHASVMWLHEDRRAEDEARLESMRSCPKCRDRRILIFQTNVPDDED